MDLGAGFLTPGNKSAGSVGAVFAMDDNDVVGDIDNVINHAGGNDYGFDSFDDGIEKSGKGRVLKDGFINTDHGNQNADELNWQFSNIFHEKDFQD